MSNNSIEHELDWKPYDNAAAVISFTLCILILGLNGLVIRTLVRKQHRKSRLHYFILHLAIADSLIGIINVFGNGLQSSMGGAWYGGDVLCRIWRFLRVVMIMASNNLLIGLSLDRYLAVAYPMMFVKRGTKLDKSLVYGAWAASAVIGVFYLPYSKGINGTAENGGLCDIKFPASWWKPYFITLLTTVYIIPTVVITICYIGICVVIWRKWRESLLLSASNDQAQAEKHKKSGLLPRAKVKSIKMTFVVCLAYFLCWTPYFVFTLLDIYQANNMDPRLYLVLGELYPLNSACNPIIFILFNLKIFVPRKPTTQSFSMDEGATLITSS